MNDTFQEKPEESEVDVPEDQIPTEKLQPLIKQKPVFAEADVAKSDEEPQADIPQSTEEQAPRQRQKRVVQQRSRLSVLRGVSNLWRTRVRRRVPPVLQLTAVECGAACLAMVLSYYGRQTRVTEIRNGYGIGRDGLSALDIVKAARSYGMRVRAISVRGQIDEFNFVSFPAIVHWEFNHFM